jgi:hypothetical protein
MEEGGGTVAHRRWYWKLYLGLMALFTAGVVGVSLYFWGEAASYYRVTDWLTLPVYVVQLVGLFGFVYGRRIGSALLWKLVLAVTVLELAWGFYGTVRDADPLFGGELAFLLGMAAVGAVVYLPLVIALFIYAFRSPGIWAGRVSVPA